jgi:hypothetical protein
MNANLESRKQSIQVNDLPVAFQDAIEITREFGFRFIWIDCLCLLQDCDKDCENECLRMAGIFRCCHIAIAAFRFSTSKQGSQGFLNREPFKRPKSIQIDLTDFCPNILSAFVSVRKHESCPALLPSLHASRRSNEELMKPSGLFSRGWVFQEMALAPRMLEYSSELKWHCNELQICDCREPSTADDRTFVSINRANVRSLTSYTIEDQKVVWMAIVKRYVQLDLTKPTDLLPGLSGIAPLYPMRASNQYLSGLLSESLPDNLLWYRSTPAPRQEEYLAPTWSWAINTGPCKLQTFKYSDKDWEPTERTPEIQDSKCQADRGHPFGKVSGGYLVVSARSFPAELLWAGDQGKGQGQAALDQQKTTYRLVFAQSQRDAYEPHWYKI